MKMIILADLFVVIIFALIMRSQPVFDVHTEDVESFRVSTSATRNGTPGSLRVTHHQEVRYLVGDNYFRLMGNVFGKCIIDSKCIVEIEFSDMKMNINNDIYRE